MDPMGDDGSWILAGVKSVDGKEKLLTVSAFMTVALDAIRAIQEIS